MTYRTSLRRVGGLLGLAAVLALAPHAEADPCGMVPPLWEGEGPAITRVGVQQTYVFYKEGVESIVIRPGFSGKVDQFGMLIPFPTVPAIRKVDDQIFPQLAMAVNPPPVVVHWPPAIPMRQLRRNVVRSSGGGGLKFSKKRVQVLKQEAVGMYEVAVLKAGGTEALQLWMEDHGYRYPEGMGAVVGDYIELGWCFVVVKAKVGPKKSVTPRPGMRDAPSDLPQGAAFDGNVQAMGFRFRTPKLVVPMRLSAFNAGKLLNRVTILTDGPQRIDGIPAALIKEQLTGSQLYANLTEPLPLKLVGSSDWSKVPASVLASYELRRDPKPKNGLARALFASDLEAVRTNRLALAHEEREKELLKIGERLGLRGEQIDALHREVLAVERDAAADRSLISLKRMTLTVIEGDFPREVLARDNLHFSEFVAKGLDAESFPVPEQIKGKARPPAERAPNKKSAEQSKDQRHGSLPRVGAGLGFGFLALLGVLGFVTRRDDLLIQVLVATGLLAPSPTATPPPATPPTPDSSQSESPQRGAK